MLRALWNFVKSPAHTFPALAAAIGCLVSGYSTFNGIAEIFPAFGYALLAAFGLAAIIQLGMLSATVSLRERTVYRPVLAAVIGITVLMSSFTSYAFYYRGYSEETIAKERQIERYESLRGYLVEARSQTSAALGIIREAGAELAQRVDIEARTGGGLRNLSSPYLQRLIGESDLDVDLATVAGGTGERFRFLTSLQSRLGQMESEVASALTTLDDELGTLTASGEVDHDGLRASYARAAAEVPADRIREVRGELALPVVDPTILDTSPLEEEEYWQRGVADLVAGQPAAIIFAFISLFIDGMIVFFAYIAGESRTHLIGSRVPLAQWVDMAYGARNADGVRAWLAALDGTRISRAGKLYHRVDLNRLEQERDGQCGRFLRQDGYLEQVMLEDGRTAWCLTDAGYRGLVQLARESTSPTSATGRAEAPNAV